MVDEASRRFVGAWHRAERSDIFHEHHLAFESWEAVFPCPDRQAAGGAALRPPAHTVSPDIRPLAKAPGRDYNNVHADVHQALTAAGLLDATVGSVRADYDAIETKTAILREIGS